LVPVGYYSFENSSNLISTAVIIHHGAGAFAVASGAILAIRAASLWTAHDVIPPEASFGIFLALDALCVLL